MPHSAAAPAADFAAAPLKERLIIGLDVPSLDEARAIVAELGEDGVFYKIGYQLVLAGGLELIRELKEQGKKVFLDLKLLDIDNTIAKATENAVKLGADMLTLHAYPKAMRAAAKAAQGSPLCLLGVTVLTSMDAGDLREAGYHAAPEELVLARAAQARQAGMGGLVASAAEAAAIRRIIGADMALVTPGIRLAGGEKGDQKRVMTPRAAIKAGASHLVVSRPIIQAADKRAAAKAVLADMAAAD